VLEGVPGAGLTEQESEMGPTGWSSVRGKSMGSTRWMRSSFITYTPWPWSVLVRIGVVSVPSAANSPTSEQESEMGPTGWSSVRGKSMGSTRGARILMRNRLKVGLGPDRRRFGSVSGKQSYFQPVAHQNAGPARSELLIHRGKEPHLAVVDVFVGGRFLTEAVADGIIISEATRANRR
jgi:hypothetical protein